MSFLLKKILFLNYILINAIPSSLCNAMQWNKPNDKKLELKRRETFCWEIFFNSKWFPHQSQPSYFFFHFLGRCSTRSVIFLWALLAKVPIFGNKQMVHIKSENTDFLLLKTSSFKTPIFFLEKFRFFGANVVKISTYAF